MSNSNSILKSLRHFLNGNTVKSLLQGPLRRCHWSLAWVSLTVTQCHIFPVFPVANVTLWVGRIFTFQVNVDNAGRQLRFLARLTLPVSFFTLSEPFPCELHGLSRCRILCNVAIDWYATPSSILFLSVCCLELSNGISRKIDLPLQSVQPAQVLRSGNSPKAAMNRDAQRKIGGGPT